MTSNRAVDEWVALVDDPILTSSALDRFAHRAHQIVMDEPSLRANKAPLPRKELPRRLEHGRRCEPTPPGGWGRGSDKLLGDTF